jgi:hypothetical protein
MSGLKPMRPLWSYFLPQTPAARLRTVSAAAPGIMLTIGAAAIIMKQAPWQGSAEASPAAAWDRVERRAYVALPDGRMALVHPKVDVDASVRGLFNSLWESCTLLP